MSENMVMELQASPLITMSPSSPSFNSYSSGTLADIAARVVREFTIDSHSSDYSDSNIPQHYFCQNGDELDFHNGSQNDVEQRQNDNDEDEDEDEDFEFAFVRGEPELTSADEIFYNGQIRPIYPLFNTDLLLEHDRQFATSRTGDGRGTATAAAAATKPTRRSPLKKLFSEERETAVTSCSSEAEDKLEGLAAGTYCVWRPRKGAEEQAQASPGRCKKSNSTGTASKRWKLRDLLLHRSNSEGKEAFVFLSASKKGSCGKENGEKEGMNGGSKKGLVAVEEHYAKSSKGMKEGDKRRSFLPYRQDLVGFLSNVNGIRKNLHP